MMTSWLLLLVTAAAQQLPAGEQQPSATRLRPTAAPSSGQGVKWAEYAEPQTAATRFKVRRAWPPATALLAAILYTVAGTCSSASTIMVPAAAAAGAAAVAVGGGGG